MVDTFKLFVSAADDLSAEREIIGHLVTEIPVTLGWQINLSPTGKSLDNAQLVMDADFHLIVIGEDIRAPVGYEWHVSRRAGKLPPIFIKQGLQRTLAAADFLKTIYHYPKLHDYTLLSGFRTQVLNQIGNYIIKHADYFELKPAEFENVSNFVQDLEDLEPNILDHVTGKDSILLTRERFIPKDGILIQSPGENQESE